MFRAQQVVGRLILVLAVLVGGWASAAQAAPPPVTGGGFADLEPKFSGRTYYVSGAGQDSNDGQSPGKAFRTLQKAADLTSPGDTVRVMNGTYTKAVADKTSPDNSVLRITRSGTADAYIRYAAMPGHRPRIFVDNNYSGIRVNAAYILIEGFTVEGNLPNLSEAEAEALAKGTDETAALTNSKFNSSGIASFPNEDRSGQPHHLIIRRNTVFNHPASGIFSNTSDYVRIEDNVVHHTSFYSPYATSGLSFYTSTQIDDSTGYKLLIRRNTVYKVENKVPFWYSNAADPSKRVITDGNAIIVDDSRHTQSDNVPYVGAFLVENNVAYDNGGRGVNVFSSDNVLARNNTLYRNARTAGFTEVGVGDSGNVTMQSNIFSVREDREPIGSYDTSNITFENNLFYGGSTAPEYPAASPSDVNLVENGSFDQDLAGWSLSANPDAGYVNNVRDEFGRNCVYLDQPDQPNPYDVYLVQRGLGLEQGKSYTVELTAASSNAVQADFAVKVGGSSAPFSTYGSRAFSLPVNSSATSSLNFAFTMAEASDANAQLELQVAGNPESTYFCFDDIAVRESVEAGATDLVGEDPLFQNASTDPRRADFRLRSQSPAIDAQTTPAPAVDIRMVRRPQGAAPDLGALERPVG
jgi:parallel beta-helix repeat protein